MMRDDAPFGDAFGARRAHVVGVDHLEHRGAHEAAVERDADDRERRDWEAEVLDAVERERSFTGVVQPGGVEDAHVPLEVDVDEENLQQQREPEGR
jgi:hypothetical protein